jgi:RNA polymerase sigma factor (sigma-70 family)
MQQVCLPIEFTSRGWAADMNGSNPRKLASRRAARSENELGCEKLLRLRRDPSVSDDQFAHTVISAPLFEQKSRLVAKVLIRHWHPDRIDDALQDAALNIYNHLRKTRGSEFCGTTDDQLGAWLYSLIVQNVQWALAKNVRSERRRKAREIKASRSETEQIISAAAFEHAFAIIENLPPPLAKIAFAIRRGTHVKEIAKDLELSERRVYELRAALFDLASKLLDGLP